MFLTKVLLLHVFCWLAYHILLMLTYWLFLYKKSAFQLIEGNLDWIFLWNGLKTTNQPTPKSIMNLNSLSLLVALSLLIGKQSAKAGFVPSLVIRTSHATCHIAWPIYLTFLRTTSCLRLLVPLMNHCWMYPVHRSTAWKNKTRKPKYDNSCQLYNTGFLKILPSLF